MEDITKLPTTTATYNRKGLLRTFRIPTASYYDP